ncbi:MAG TPA: PAS domain S-box protein [Phycisphaerae bacterium]|nr:PAS domain S-box protein [Phycisphaerae bacterium]HRW52699.1 PAS domain S-box protein [Phycisphaerae bacterium]
MSPPRANDVENAERLRAIVETAVDGIITIDSFGNVESMNPASERMFGYAADEVIGRNISILMPEPYCSEHNAYLRRYLQTGERRIIGIGREVLGRRKDGSTFPMELAVSEMLLDGRRMFTGIVRDVTERRAAEDELRRLAALLDDSNDAIKSLDLHGNIITWNAGAERLYGYTPARALQMNIRELLPIERSDEMVRMTERLLKGDRIPPFETRRVAADGRLVEIQCTLTLLKGRDDKPDEVVVTDRDITERKQNEAALRGSEAQTRAIVEAAVDGIITINAEGQIESLNRAAERLFGYESTELIGRNVNMLMPSPYQEEHDGYVKRYLRTGVKKIIGIGREVVGRRRDGSTFPMELAISELTVNDRRMFTGIVRDISERKRIEEEIKAQAMCLEDNNRVLQEASIRASEATAAKSQFLANMSHEIRTPMTAILGFADELMDGSMSGNEQRHALNIIRRNGEHLLQIINDILDISKIEAGKLEVEKRQCALRDVIADVESLMAPRADDRGLTISSEVSADVPQVIVSDPMRLKQILVNLVGNAVKFTEHGGVSVVASVLKTPRVPMLRIDVVDTGIGISKEDAARLFQAFTQADNSTTRRFGGTGLGLMISQRLAMLLGGDLTVRSTPGVGSRFTLTIRADVCDPRGVDAAPEPTIDRRKAPEVRDQRLDCTVLLVEDGGDNQRLISHVLRRAGAHVTVAENGQVGADLALRAMEAGDRYDVILMDMQMPVMDGYEATRLIRSKGYAGWIVALTAHAMSSDRRKCLDAGCDEFLTKPIDRRKLLDAIRICLDPTVDPPHQRKSGASGA